MPTMPATVHPAPPPLPLKWGPVSPRNSPICRSQWVVLKAALGVLGSVRLGIVLFWGRVVQLGGFLKKPDIFLVKNHP